MIPAFPEFKKLELSDKDQVESVTRCRSPYSDFNFISMWSWNIKGEMQLSLLNGNLVVRFTDYMTGEPFYSFLGVTRPNETAKLLIETASSEGISNNLKLLPDVSVRELDPSIFVITEDQDQHDYVTSVYHLHTYEGEELRAKRRQHSLFKRRHAQFEFRILEVSNPNTISDIETLFSIWHVNKDPEQAIEERHEFVALKRCLEARFSDLLVTGIYFQDEIAAFWILEDLNNGYAISHFEKADSHKYIGIFPFLKQKTAEVLHSREIVYVNLEQDLGIEGLRANKASYHPQHFLKKYTVAEKPSP